ncbi:MAG: AraC family transcriptional regulator [Lachnospiraceae bacterium]
MKYIEYKEHKKHGTLDFPVEFYHVTPSHPRYQMSYHWHMEHEIIRIIKGELLVTIEEQEFTACSGDVVFVHGGVLHGGIPDQCIYECIVFDLETLVKHAYVCQKEMQGIVTHSLLVQNLFTSSDNEFHKIAGTLFETMRSKGTGYELTILGCFYQLFGCILKNHYYVPSSEEPAKNSKRILQLKKALELIETAYPDCITLDDLAKVAGMNSKYFCRFFQEMTHRTPINYLNYYRVERACFELVTSEASITEVALNCGFNDSSYFVKTFKKFKGITPKKYLSGLPH